MPDKFKRFTAKIIYRNKYWVAQVLGFLGLWGLFYRLYCRFWGPDGGISEIKVGGQTALFYVHAQSDADNLKSLWGEGYLLGSLMKILGSGDCVYDIGAEFGLYSVFLSRAVGEKGRVIAFEPENIRCKRLKENLKLNKLKNVRIFSLALGDKNGEEELLIGRNDVAPGFINLPGAVNSHRSTQKVKIKNGDGFVSEAGLPLPDAVKIDVEGYEYYVIKGLEKTLKSENCRIICCEVHPNMLPPGINPGMVLELIKFYGFAKIDVHNRENDFQILAQKYKQVR